jgi:hypothetical protein
MSAMVQLTGGHFQDSEGNVLADGYLKFVLNQDSSVNNSQICSGVEITIYLDAFGDVISSPGQFVWGNDQLSPENSYYTVTGYTAEGQIAWGPNNQQVTGNGGTFDLGTWIPNQVISWFPSLQAGIGVEVEGSPLSSSTVLDLVNTGNVTFTDNGGGRVSASASIPSGPTLKTNSILNGDQALLNLVDGTNIHITQDGSGDVTVNNTAPLAPASLPPPDVAAFHFMQVCPSATLAPYMISIPGQIIGYSANNAATLISPSASNGWGCRFNATNNSLSYLLEPSFPWALPAHGLKFKTTAQVTVTSGYGMWFIGTVNVWGGAIGDILASGTDCIGFIINVTVAGPGNFLLIADVNGSPTPVDTLIPVGSGVRHTLEFTLFGGVLTPIIDGVVLGTKTITTGIPTSTQQMWFCNNANVPVTGNTMVSTFITEYMYLEDTTP